MQKSRKSPESKVLLEMLNQLRNSSGVRQIDLAEKLDVHQSFVSKYESGERRLDLIELRRICNSLGTNVIEFVTEFEERVSHLRST